MVQSYSFLDFVIDVEAGRDIIVLQLTDTQIIDASQKRYPERLGIYSDMYWAKDKVEERCFGCLREIIETVKPDLIILTGDIVYGSFDDEGTSLLLLIEFMESMHVPWAPVFGNHDNESKKGVDWQCEQLKNASNCLFEQRKLTGNGNYTVGIRQGGRVKRVFFMLDSNGCSAMSEETLANGHSSGVCGFEKDQIEWYTSTASLLRELYPNIGISFAFHIQPQIFADAFSKYGFINKDTKSHPIKIDDLESAEVCDFGYLGEDLKNAWDLDYGVWNGLRKLGCDSVFAGHVHCNSASAMFQGIRCQYGLKSSTYDRANYRDAEGNIIGSYSSKGIPIVGGTVIPICEVDGTILKPYHVLAGDSRQSK